MKTCAAGCHFWDNGQWKEMTGARSCRWVGSKFYCFASHAELLPGGEVREMVALEVAANAMHYQGCSVICPGRNLEACTGDECAEALRTYLRKVSKEVKP